MFLECTDICEFTFNLLISKASGETTGSIKMDPLGPSSDTALPIVASDKITSSNDIMCIYFSVTIHVVLHLCICVETCIL